MDAKWLEILKENGWKTGAISVGCGAFLLLIHLGFIPIPENLIWIYIPWILFLTSMSLTFASMAKRITDYIQPQEKFDKWRKQKIERARVIDEINYLDDIEKDIIGYMLFNKKRMVTIDIDGGSINTLISKGIFRRALRPGQGFDMLSVPHEIPRHIWEILEENREQFPSQPSARFREGNAPPYRGGQWGARDKHGRLIIQRSSTIAED